MAAGLSCSSLVVSLLVCGADQTAVSTALSMQCHVHIPEPSHPSPRAGVCRYWRSECLVSYLLDSRVVSCALSTGLPTARLPGDLLGIRAVGPAVLDFSWKRWPTSYSRVDGCTASLKCCARRLCVPQKG